MSILALVLKWLAGGVLDRVMAFLEHRMDAKTERERPMIETGSPCVSGVREHDGTNLSFQPFQACRIQGARSARNSVSDILIAVPHDHAYVDAIRAVRRARGMLLEFRTKMNYPETVKVRVIWDSEANVFVAESDDVPGLVTEAETFEALVDKIGRLVPELLELNEAEPQRGTIQLCVEAEYTRTLAFTGNG